MPRRVPSALEKQPIDCRTTLISGTSKPEIRPTMLYPLYVWKDEHSAYGGTFPDLPGVNTAADTLDELPAMAQEAVLAMYDQSTAVIPPASTIERWHENADYTGGFWMLIDISTQPAVIP
jgi:predicted RNase H-like HicB family nuclease